MDYYLNEVSLYTPFRNNLFSSIWISFYNTTIFPNSNRQSHSKCFLHRFFSGFTRSLAQNFRGNFIILNIYGFIFYPIVCVLAHIV